MEWLLVVPHLALRNINLDWYDANGKLLPISHLDLNLHNSANKNVLWGEASLAQTIPSKLKFVVDLTGSWNKNRL